MVVEDVVTAEDVVAAEDVVVEETVSAEVSLNDWVALPQLVENKAASKTTTTFFISVNHSNQKNRQKSRLNGLMFRLLSLQTFHHHEESAHRTN